MPLEVADIFRHYGPAYRLANPLPYSQRRVMRAIEMRFQLVCD